MDNMVQTLKQKINNLNPLVLLLIFLIIFLPIKFITYNHTIAGGDQGEFVNNPIRIIHGQLPYKDFWLTFPPGEVYLPASIYQLFGVNINFALMLYPITALLTAIITFLIGKSLFQQNLYALLLTTIVYLVGTSTYKYFLFSLISIFFFINYIKKNKLNYLFLTGVFIGISFIFRFYEVGSTLLVLVLVILFYSKKTIKHLAILAIPIFLILFLTFIPFIPYYEQTIQNIVFEGPRIASASSTNTPYFITSEYYLNSFLNTQHLRDKTYFFLRFILVTTMYLLPFIVIPIALLYQFNSNIKKTNKIIILLFSLWGFFSLGKVKFMSDISHLVYVVSPLFFPTLLILKNSFKNYNKNNFEKITYYLFLIITLILVIIPVPIFFIKNIHGMSLTRYEIKSEYGSLLILNQSEAEDINKVIEFINQNTNPSDTIFVTPIDAPPFYALTNRLNPTYHDCLGPLVIKPSEETQKEICNDLLNTKLIIHYPYWGFDQDGFWGFKETPELQFLNSMPFLQKCIEENFELKEKYGKYWIYLNPKL